MSAYKRIKCKIVNKDCLKQALEDLGLQYTESETPVALHGFTGDVRSQKAEIIVSRQELNKTFTGASNDLGFAWNSKDEAYDMICSDYDASVKLPQRVMQAYAVSVIQKAAAANHFSLKQSVDSKKLQSKERQKVKLVFGKVI